MTWLTSMTYTWLDYVNDIREIVAKRQDAATAKKLRAAPISLYSPDILRLYFTNSYDYGVTDHEPTRWNGSPPRVGIFPQENWRVPETVVHELGHVIAGVDASHGPAWVAATRKLGLHVTEADAFAGNDCPDYWRKKFDPDLLAAIRALPRPADPMPRLDFDAWVQPEEFI